MGCSSIRLRPLFFAVFRSVQDAVHIVLLRDGEDLRGRVDRLIRVHCCAVPDHPVVQPADLPPSFQIKRHIRPFDPSVSGGSFLSENPKKPQLFALHGASGCAAARWLFRSRAEICIENEREILDFGTVFCYYILLLKRAIVIRVKDLTE